MKIIGIYKWISPTNRIYIGQSIDINKRRKRYEHIRNDSQPKLRRSFQKYGIENHTFEIIEECSIEQLNEKEIYWKQYYLNKVKGNWSKVLFCELYDTGGGPRNQITKDKISNSLKGKLKPNGFGEKVSIANKGKICSKDTKLKMSNSHKGKLKPWVKGKKKNKLIKKLKQKNTIYQYNLNGEFLKEWRNAEEVYKSGFGSNFLWKVLKSNGKLTYKGFLFLYEKIDKAIPTTRWKNNKKQVLQFDLEGNLIKEWESAKEITRNLDIKIQNITSCCRGEVKTCKKYIWKYKEN